LKGIVLRRTLLSSCHKLFFKKFNLSSIFRESVLLSCCRRLFFKELNLSRIFRPFTASLGMADHGENADLPQG
jgi:hypothetical protein